MLAKQLTTDKRVPLDESLIAVINNAIYQARITHVSESGVAKACKILLDLVEASAESSCKVSLNALYSLCINIKPFLSEEERASTTPLVRQTMKRIRKLLLEKRDPARPLLPHRVLPFETRRYPGIPWYMASFIFDDPVFSGTTEETHIAYIRTPNPVMTVGEDFNLDFFRTYDYFEGKPILMRIHSECVLGDTAIGQARCDCGYQLVNAMDKINDAGCGILLYLRQEGRGIGLKKKLEAIEQSGARQRGKWTGDYLNTEENMLIEGHRKADLRDYRFVSRILHGLGVREVRLITNNPTKVSSLRSLGFHVEQTHATGVATTNENLSEFLWKILNNYNIPFNSISSIENHIADLKKGHQIEPTIYKLLTQLLILIREKPQNHTVPLQMVNLLESVSDQLLAQ